MVGQIETDFNEDRAPTGADDVRVIDPRTTSNDRTEAVHEASDHERHR
jgi:hypothetical protein